MKHRYSKNSAVQVPGTYRVRVHIPVRRYVCRVRQKGDRYVWFIRVRRGYAYRVRQKRVQYVWFIRVRHGGKELLMASRAIVRRRRLLSDYLNVSVCSVQSFQNLGHGQSRKCLDSSGLSPSANNPSQGLNGMKDEGAILVVNDDLLNLSALGLLRHKCYGITTSGCVTIYFLNGGQVDAIIHSLFFYICNASS
ncbi:hypothetical protein HYC85_013245 [Camellia sinensis]|uniref:Uncharacterized protein n=1 Tax=Camellia sinensis TaxID=4442 RepID=A0A7J7H6F3_CAMSI|nr:hypothetical protein HYC85_013245 [Camellia sinensis]